MANTVIVKKLLDGPRTAIFSVYMKSDGASGELVNKTVIDPNVDLSPAMGVGMKLSIVKVWYGLAGFDILMQFDSLVDSPIWVLPAATGSRMIDFSDFGGLQDNISGIDATGKLIVTTTGFNSTADQGSLVIKVNKTPKTYTVA